MRKIHEYRPAVLLALFAGAVMTFAPVAGAFTLTVNESASVDSPFDAPHSGTPAAGEAKSGNKSSLRCWQFGRLIFEESGLELPEQPKVKSLRLRDVKQPGVQVVLFHTKDAVCMWKDAIP